MVTHQLFFRVACSGCSDVQRSLKVCRYQ